MKYQVRALVQMPDGSFEWRPIAVETDKGRAVKSLPTEQEAADWKRYCLLDWTSVWPVKD